MAYYLFTNIAAEWAGAEWADRLVILCAIVDIRVFQGGYIYFRVLSARKSEIKSLLVILST